MSRYFEPLPHFRWLVSAAARSWQLLRDSEPPIKGHILDGSLEAHRVLMLSRWKRASAVAAMRNRPHARDIIGDLERIAHEAAHCYRVICELEGKDALPEPDNHPVLERQLAKYAGIWQDIWHSFRPSPSGFR